MPLRNGDELPRHSPRAAPRAGILERRDETALLPGAMNRFCQPLFVELALGHFHRCRAFQAPGTHETPLASATPIDLLAAALKPEEEELVLRHEAEVVCPMLLCLLGGDEDTHPTTVARPIRRIGVRSDRSKTCPAIKTRCLGISASPSSGGTATDSASASASASASGSASGSVSASASASASGLGSRISDSARQRPECPGMGSDPIFGQRGARPGWAAWPGEAHRVESR